MIQNCRKILLPHVSKQQVLPGYIFSGHQIGNMIYIIKEPRFTHKRHLNQMRKRYSNTVENNPREEDSVNVVFDTFDVSIPQMTPELGKSKKKKKKKKKGILDLIEINPQKKNY